jgi:hypothetical protein
MSGRAVFLFLPWALAIFLPTLADSRTWHVLNDGSGEAPSVQAGIDSSGSGDTVLVGPGTYGENINFLGKEVVVLSQVGPAVTILDGGAREESVVLMISDEGSGAILDGFTITNGRGHRISVDQTDGGGIFIRARTPIIRNNVFYRNTGLPYGGAIYIDAASQTAIPVATIIEDNVFDQNHASLGGAIADLWGDTIIKGNIFRNNGAVYDGGGIFIWMRSGEPIVEYNQFWDNLAQDHGGGVYASDQGISRGMILVRNLFVRNRASGSGNGDTGSGGAIWYSFGGGVLSNNTLVNNIGTGESICGGGGLLLDGTNSNLEVTDNIIAFNGSCGLACETQVATLPGRNCFWQNVDGDLGSAQRTCDAGWRSLAVVTNPLFCDPAADDYTLASNSPVLGMGAFPDQACPPVSIKRVTWGRLKSTY